MRQYGAGKNERSHCKWDGLIRPNRSEHEIRTAAFPDSGRMVKKYDQKARQRKSKNQKGMSCAEVRNQLEAISKGRSCRADDRSRRRAQSGPFQKGKDIFENRKRLFLSHYHL